jgi:glycosyltransferase involved in cell wall biosynthesis
VRRLRIGWATPWNGRSAIASSAAEVAFTLAQQGHELTVLRTETGEWADLPPKSAPGLVQPLASLDDAALRASFDVIVAQIGDHYGFHGAIIRRLDAVNMVGVFHDAYLVNLANGHAQQLGGEPALRQLVLETYGESALHSDEPLWTNLEEIARRRPMLEWLARRTVAAVAHSGHYAARLRSACPGPVATIPLAFTAPGLPPPPPPGSRMTIAAIGHANPNKRIDQILMAIGASPILRGRCRLRVIGEATPAERERLTAVAVAARAAAPEFTGWVTDDALRGQLRDVDVISCLRNPVLEGASASLVVALASGRPTLVTDHGCYAEVPPDTVMACRPTDEALDAMRHLEHLLADPAWGAAMGTRGRALAAERHAPSAYAKALLPLLEEVVADRPLHDTQRQLLASGSDPLHDARKQLFGTLAELGLDPGDPAFRRVNVTLDGMRAGPAKRARPAQEEKPT